MSALSYPERALRSQARLYPNLQPQDVLKCLYQGAFGPEHLGVDEVLLRQKLEAEFLGAPCPESPVEVLSESFCRVPLSALREGLSPATFARLIALSVRGRPADAAGRLEEGLCLAFSLVRAGTFGFSEAEFEAEVARWRAEGMGAMHHSELFRASYHPAYRVLHRPYAALLPLLCRLDELLKEGRVLLAIDGGAASGKSTVSGLLARVYDACVFHMDDFFLQAHQRTRERLCSPGGNVDRERVEEEILRPYRQGRKVAFRRYDCATGSLSAPICAPCRALTVLEGAYSMHPDLVGYYDLCVFLEISSGEQRARIEARDPLLAPRFFSEWIPMEQAYFRAFSIRARADLVLNTQEEEPPVF